MAPAHVQRPRERLATLKRPGRPGSTAAPSRPLQKKPTTCCDTPQHSTEDSHTVCLNCGQEVSDANIVSEVTFGETAAGAAVVQGGQVGENQRYAKSSLGPGFRRGMGTESREQTEKNGVCHPM